MLWKMCSFITWPQQDTPEIEFLKIKIVLIINVLDEGLVLKTFSTLNALQKFAVNIYLQLKLVRYLFIRNEAFRMHKLSVFLFYYAN